MTSRILLVAATLLVGSTATANELFIGASDFRGFRSTAEGNADGDLGFDASYTMARAGFLGAPGFISSSDSLEGFTPSAIVDGSYADPPLTMFDLDFGMTGVTATVMVTGDFQPSVITDVDVQNPSQDPTGNLRDATDGDNMFFTGLPDGQGVPQTGALLIDFDPEAAVRGFGFSITDLGDFGATLTITHDDGAEELISINPADPDGLPEGLEPDDFQNGDHLWLSFIGDATIDSVSITMTNPTAVGDIFSFDEFSVVVAEPMAFLDIKPGSCPNPFNRNSQGVMPAAIVGTTDIDVTMIDLDSIVLTRADGIGGTVMPLQGPPGPGIEISDVATPYMADDDCGCHELGGDGIDDLSMKFDSPTVGSELELDGLMPGDTVELQIEFMLLDGTVHTATDCIRIVGGGMNDILMVLQSWGECSGACPADLDDNGQVDIADLLIVLANLH